jgi:tetratricopeptide (TPR) repeat protein
MRNALISAIILLLFNNSYSITNNLFIATETNNSVAMQLYTTDSINAVFDKAKKLDISNKKEKALKIYLELLEYSKLNNDTTRQINCCVYISNILKSTNNFSKALDYSKSALLLALETKDSTSILDNHISIGTLHFKLFSSDSLTYPKAIDSIEYHFRKALTYSSNKAKYSKQIGAIYNGLSSHYFYRKDYDSAKKLILQSIDKATERNDIISQIISTNTLASIYLQTKKYKLAKEVTKKHTTYLKQQTPLEKSN